MQVKGNQNVSLDGVRVDHGHVRATFRFRNQSIDLHSEKLLHDDEMTTGH